MKNFLKLFLSFVVVMVAAIALVSCGDTDGGNTGGGTTEGGNTDGGTTATLNRDVAVDKANLTKMVGEGGKIYVTALGQADRDYIKDICEDALGAEAFTFDNQLKADDVNAGDLVISVVGYTSKGISGDITQTGEVARAKAFAEKEGLNFVLVQLDGKSRRGESTDPIIEAAVGGADLVLIYDANDGKGADYDGKYSTVWCKDKLDKLFLFKNEYNIKDYIEAIAK